MYLASCGAISEEYEKQGIILFEGLKDLDPEFSDEMGSVSLSRFFTPEQKEKFKEMSADQINDFQTHCDRVFAALEEETSPLDDRYATPKATWNTFVTSLKDGDKQTLINSLAGEARERLGPGLQKRPIQELREIGKLYVDIKLKEDEYVDALGYQEATSIKSDGRKGVVIFYRIGRNWKITTI